MVAYTKAEFKQMLAKSCVIFSKSVTHFLSLHAALISASSLINISTMSKAPLVEARCNGVKPS